MLKLILASLVTIHSNKYCQFWPSPAPPRLGAHHGASNMFSSATLGGCLHLWHRLSAYFKWHRCNTDYADGLTLSSFDSMIYVSILCRYRSALVLCLDSHDCAFLYLPNCLWPPYGRLFRRFVVLSLACKIRGMIHRWLG